FFHIVLLFLTIPLPPTPYSLSLHDALPISGDVRVRRVLPLRRPVLHRVPHGPGRPHRQARPLSLRHLRRLRVGLPEPAPSVGVRDRKSTRLNSSHGSISYAVFCLKKKKSIT